MSKPLKVQILEKARTLIEDERHWCREIEARIDVALSNVDDLPVERHSALTSGVKESLPTTR
jgi:hypothetical protein